MQIKRKIRGDNWKIRVVDDEGMIAQREDGASLAGLTIPSEKLILIHKENVDYATVAHELYHAYFSYLYLDDTNELKITDIEEIVCAFFAAEGETIVKKAKKILRDLQKGQDDE